MVNYPDDIYTEPSDGDVYTLKESGTTDRHGRSQAEPFHHTDRNILTKLAEPTPNPLARG